MRENERSHGWRRGGEDAWIRAVQKHGSRTAAEKLVRTHYDEIYVFVYRQTGRKEDALDLTQNIFMAVLRALPSFDRRKATFRTWLYRIATNKVIDARRRQRPHTLPLDDVDPPDHVDFAANVNDRLLLDQIEAYVSALDPQVQAVYRLHLYAEKPFSEVACILGQSEAAVKSQYYRLMACLRKEFDPHA